jgi:hypothetical protein
VVLDFSALQGDQVAELQQHAFDDGRPQEYLVVHVQADRGRTGDVFLVGIVVCEPWPSLLPIDKPRQRLGAVILPDRHRANP